MEDDANIQDDDYLYRHINPLFILPTEPPRITSQAFQNYPKRDQFSANLESLMNLHGQQASDLIADLPGYGIAKLQVAQVRVLGQGVTLDPLINDPSHVHVNGKKNKSTKSRLAEVASTQVVIWPGD